MATMKFLGIAMNLFVDHEKCESRTDQGTKSGSQGSELKVTIGLVIIDFKSEARACDSYQVYHLLKRTGLPKPKLIPSLMATG